MTDGTVVLILVSETLVCVKDSDGDAHAALFAVTKVLHAPDSAKAAAEAVIWFLRLRHPEFANVAVILSKDSLAVGALVSVEQVVRVRDTVYEI